MFPDKIQLVFLHEGTLEDVASWYLLLLICVVLIVAGFAKKRKAKVQTPKQIPDSQERSQRLRRNCSR